jgi:hypothetical protein
MKMAAALYVPCKMALDRSCEAEAVLTSVVIGGAKVGGSARTT